MTEGLVVTRQQLIELLNDNGYEYEASSKDVCDVLEDAGLLVVRREELLKNAKTVKEITRYLRACIGEAIPLAENEKWVHFPNELLEAKSETRNKP